MEGKFGRLFTEGDVLAIVEDVVQMGTVKERQGIAACTHEAIRRGTPTFPADEPLFLLRGQDSAAPDAIHERGLVDPTRACCYSESCLRRDAGPSHVAAVIEAADAMRDWQRENPDRVKIPD